MGKEAPVYRVELAGEDLASLNFTSFVESVEVDLSEKKGQKPKTSTCRITISNPNFRFTNNPMFSGKVFARIWMGYDDELIEKGTFLIDQPANNFDNNPARIELNGKGQVVELAEVDQKRSHQGKKLSDIAQQIADEYGLEADIEDSLVVYDNLVQINSDALFLLERSRMIGFKFYVLNGVLHFHSDRFEKVENQSGPVVLRYKTNDVNNVESFKIKERKFRKGSTGKSKTVNPLTGKVDETDIEEPALVSNASDSVVKWIADGGGFVTVQGKSGDKTPTSDVTNAAAAITTPEEMKQIVGAETERRMWITKATVLMATPEPSLMPRMWVPAEGLFKYSGDYRIGSTKEKIIGTRYSQSLEIESTGMDQPTGESSTVGDVGGAGQPNDAANKQDVTPPVVQWVPLDGGTFIQRQ